MKKFLCYLLSFMLVAVLCFVPMEKTYAKSLKLSASSTSIDVGESVTITLTVPSGYMAECSISVSNSDVLSGSYESKAVRGDAFGNESSYSFSLKGKSAGTAEVSVTCTVATDVEENYVSLSAASVTITVNNESVEEEKSSDNYLKSLSLSDGSLSPGFSKNTTEYSTTVPNDVTSIYVSATPNDSKASVTSVSGNEGLSVGRNTVTITVKAENGTTRTYTIVVTRQEADEQESESEEPTETENTENTETQEGGTFTLNGKKLTPAQEIPEEEYPADFELSNIFLGGVSYPSLEYQNGDIVLLYLTEEGKEIGTLYVYDHNQDAVYPFIKITSESGYIIALMPEESEIPDGYEELSLSIEGKGVVTAYQSEDLVESNVVPAEENTETPEETEGDNLGFLDWFMPETVMAAETQPDETDFYLMYCINHLGQTGWYRYDYAEGTYQRVVDLEEQSDASDTEQAALDYTNLQKEFNDYKTKVMFVAAIGLVILVVLLVSLIAVIASKKKELPDDMELDIDELEDDFEDENPEDTTDDSEIETSDSDDEVPVNKATSVPITKVHIEPTEIVDEKPTDSETTDAEQSVEASHSAAEIAEKAAGAAKVEKPEEARKLQQSEPEVVTIKKEKFATIDLTDLAAQLEKQAEATAQEERKDEARLEEMVKAEKTSSIVSGMTGEIHISPKEEIQQIMNHISEGEKVEDNDDDFTIIDL